MSISKKPVVDSTDEQVGDEIVITQTGPEPKSLLDEPQLQAKPVDPEIQVATAADLDADRLALEAFMQEEVEILVQEPLDVETGDVWMIPLTVGDTTQWVFRGQPQKIKRKYVEVLARARRAGVTAKGIKRADGEAINDFRKSTRALEYPYQVLADPSGAKGQAWNIALLRSEN